MFKRTPQEVSEPERRLAALFVVEVLVDVAGEAGTGVPKPLAHDSDVHTVFDKEAGVGVAWPVHSYRRYPGGLAKLFKYAREVARVQVCPELRWEHEVEV